MWNTWCTVCARHMPHMAALSYIRTDVSLVVKRMRTHTHIYTPPYGSVPMLSPHLLHKHCSLFRLQTHFIFHKHIINTLNIITHVKATATQ